MSHRHQKASLTLVQLSLLMFFSVFCSSSTIHAQGARFFVQPSNVNFGTTSAGKTVTKFVIITSFDSSKSVHGHVVSPSSSNFALLSLDTVVVAPRGRDTIKLEFHPAQAGTFSDTVYFFHDGDTSQFSKNPVMIRLSGSATAVGDTSPRMQVSLQPISFTANVDSVQVRTVRIVNVSDTIRWLTGMAIGVSSPFSIQSGAQFSIVTGDTALIRIAFSPKATGNFRDTLTIQSNALAPNSLVQIVLSGVVQGVQQVSVTPTFVNFKSAVDSSARRSVIIRNLTLTSMVGSITGIHEPFSFVNGPVTFSLAKGDTLAVPIDFRPTVAGQSLDTIYVESNADQKKIAVLLAGTATSPIGDTATHISISLEMIDFGKIFVGKSAAGALTLSNTSSTATLTGEVFPSKAPFNVNNGSGAFSLAPGGTRNIRIGFLPVAPGSFMDSIVITSNAEGQGGRRVVKLVGTSEDAPLGVAPESARSEQLRIEPNPAQGRFTVSGSSVSATTTIEIINADGIVVDRQRSSASSLDVSTEKLPSGTYVVRAVTAGEVRITKLVIQK